MHLLLLLLLLRRRQYAATAAATSSQKGGKCLRNLINEVIITAAVLKTGDPTKCLGRRLVPRVNRRFHY